MTWRFWNTFTRILSETPPSSVTSRLERAASTSSISCSLEWSTGSVDTVSLQMWYCKDKTKAQVYSLAKQNWQTIWFPFLMCNDVTLSYSPVARQTWASPPRCSRYPRAGWTTEPARRAALSLRHRTETQHASIYQLVTFGPDWPVRVIFVWESKYIYIQNAETVAPRWDFKCH